MQVDDTVLCTNCNSKILKKCQLIHTYACQNKNNKIKEKGFFSKLINSKQQKQKQQVIPCLQCGESITFSLYAIHQQQCVGHQLTKCNKCQILFPTFLFDEHLQVCTGIKIAPLKVDPLVNKINQPLFEKNQILKFDQFQQEDLQLNSSDEDQNPLYMMIQELAKNEILNVKLTQDPLKQNQLKTLNQISLKVQEQCSICCCQMNTTTRHVKLNCKHLYHKKCIYSWLGKNPYCPMCRQHALKR